MARLVGCVMSLSVLMGAHINSAEYYAIQEDDAYGRLDLQIEIGRNQYEVFYIRQQHFGDVIIGEYSFTTADLGKIVASDACKEEARAYVLRSIQNGDIRHIEALDVPHR